jgi:hypothetical protein
MPKYPENENAAKPLSDEETQKLMDGSPEDRDLLRKDVSERLQAALDLSTVEDSWFEIGKIFDSLAYKIYEEEFMPAPVKDLPPKDRLLNYIKHYHSYSEGIKIRMAKLLGYSAETLERLFHHESGFKKHGLRLPDNKSAAGVGMEGHTSQRNREIAEALESQRKKINEFYGLRGDASFEQVGAWRKSVEMFETEEKALRIYFIDRLRAAFGLKLSDESLWSTINELVGEELIKLTQGESDKPKEGLLKMLGAVHPDDMAAVYDRFCVLMGFPTGTFDDLYECIEKGMKLEKELRIILKN